MVERAHLLLCAPGDGESSRWERGERGGSNWCAWKVRPLPVVALVKASGKKTVRMSSTVPIPRHSDAPRVSRGKRLSGTARPLRAATRALLRRFSDVVRAPLKRLSCDARAPVAGVTAAPFRRIRDRQAPRMGEYNNASGTSELSHATMRRSSTPLVSRPTTTSTMATQAYNASIA